MKKKANKVIGLIYRHFYANCYYLHCTIAKCWSAHSLSTALSQWSGTHYHLLTSPLANLPGQHCALKLLSKSWPTDYSFLLSQFCLSTLERRRKLTKVAIIFKLKLNLMHSPNSPLRSPPPPPYSLKHYDPHNYLPIICKTHFFSTSFYPMQQPSNLFPSNPWLHLPFSISNPGWRQSSFNY